MKIPESQKRFFGKRKGTVTAMFYHSRGHHLTIGRMWRNIQRTVSWEQMKRMAQRSRKQVETRVGLRVAEIIKSVIIEGISDYGRCLGK